MSTGTEAVTWLSCLTPPGQAALATLALRGPRAWQLVRELFRPRGKAALPEAAEAGRFWLGKMGGDVGDDVVVAVKRGGEQPWVEVHTHGGRQVGLFLSELLTARGARLCSWEELWRQTENDGLQAAAAIALTRAPTLQTARILLDQYQGALARALDDLVALLAHGDEEQAAAALAQLCRSGKLGRRLTEPWRVVVAGAPNVGKSSLVNALAGYARSVVAATPGTTRDVVTTRLALDGWLIELADTAGQREAAEQLEEQGIAQARARADSADLCLWVLDASTPPLWPPTVSERLQLAINKVDLPAAWRLDDASDAVRVSAVTGAGIAELGSTLIRRLVPEPPAPGAAVLFTADLAERTEQALHHLQGGDVASALHLLEKMRRGEGIS